MYKNVLVFKHFKGRLRRDEDDDADLTAVGLELNVQKSPKTCT